MNITSFIIVADARTYIYFVLGFACFLPRGWVCVWRGGEGGEGGTYKEQDKMERELTGKDGDQRPGKGRIGERANPAISCQEGRKKSRRGL